MRRSTTDRAALPLPRDHSMPCGQTAVMHSMRQAGAQWLQDRRPAVKDSTYIKYESIWRCHIEPALGYMGVAAVTTPVVDGFAHSLAQRQLAAKTIHDVLTVLRSILGFAAALGWEVSPRLYIRCPSQPRKPIRVLSRTEQDRLVAYLCQGMDYCKFGILLALLTGMRIGEVCALRWGNISLSQRVIFIDATMQRLHVLDGDGARKTRVVVGSPKSSAAVRAIPMSDHAAALCVRMGSGAGPECFVLTGTEQYMEPRLVQLRMKKYAEACGLEGVHFHTLRHTFATRSVEVGFELKSLSEVLGHANTAITLNLYVHASMDLKRSNMNKLAQAGL